ncbi:hypothetical protein [Streptomyces sp. NPDC001975]
MSQRYDAQEIEQSEERVFGQRCRRVEVGGQDGEERAGVRGVPGLDGPGDGTAAGVVGFG